MKSSHYRRMASLKELVLIDQHEHRVETQTRQSNGTWLLREYRLPDEVVALESLVISIAMHEVYRAVAFAS